MIQQRNTKHHRSYVAHAPSEWRKSLPKSGRVKMSSLLVFLPTIHTLHTHPTSMHPPSVLPLSPLCSSENRQLGFGLNHMVTGLIKIDFMLQPGVRLKNNKCQNTEHFLYPVSMHLSNFPLPLFLLSLLWSILSASSRKHSELDPHFIISLSVEQYSFAVKYRASCF